jgi:hypothetical protein
MDLFDEILDTERGPRLRARRDLDVIVDVLGTDEVKVLERIAARLQRGAATYGSLHIAADGRAFRSREAREELEDALVYLACAWLKSEGHV